MYVYIFSAQCALDFTVRNLRYVYFGKMNGLVEHVQNDLKALAEFLVS